MKKRILILDTSSVLHSVKFSLAKHRLSNKELPTFVIYGFLLKLQFLLKKTKADLIVYATDSDTSKRKEIYSIYKEKRSKNKTEQQIALDKVAYPQFDAIKQYVLPTMGYKNIYGVDGLEADDIIGSLCKNHPHQELIICSNDQDMYQLLTQNICIFDPRTNMWYTKTKFMNEYGIEPHMWKRVKAIGGCSSDNVKGVPIPQPDPTKKQSHVAEKGALNFLKDDMGHNTRAYKAIVSRAGKRIINRNKTLVILPFKGTPKFHIVSDYPTESGLEEVCEKYGFKSILSDWRNWKQALKLR